MASRADRIRRLNWTDRPKNDTEKRMASLGRFTTRTIFVQIKCTPGTAYEVAARLVEDIDPAPEVFSTSGQYDLMARFHLDAEQDPGMFVTKNVQRIKGVADTFTTLAFDAFTPDRNPG